MLTMILIGFIIAHVNDNHYQLIIRAFTDNEKNKVKGKNP